RHPARPAAPAGAGQRITSTVRQAPRRGAPWPPVARAWDGTAYGPVSRRGTGGLRGPGGKGGLLDHLAEPPGTPGHPPWLEEARCLFRRGCRILEVWSSSGTSRTSGRGGRRVWASAHLLITLRCTSRHTVPRT